MHIVIVGSGVAGITAARTIRENDSGAKISIYSDENHLYYPRPRLYEVLSGELDPQETYMFDDHWYKKRAIAVHLNNKVSSIEIDEKRLLLKNRSKVDYDKLLLANGAHPFLPPIPGVEKTGVFSLRSIKDALEIREYTKKSERAVIVGGGLLGLEFAASLRKLGQQVEVVEIAHRLLPRQLDQAGATILKDRIESRDIRVELGVRIEKILGKKTATGILLDRERELSCDLVLVSAGVRPNVDLAMEAGIEVNRGVVVDEYLQTTANDVYAVGDVAEFRGRVYGIIPAALEQARIAAMNMLEDGKHVYQGTIPSNTLKVVGIDLTSMGLVNPDESRYEEIKRIDQKKGVYKKVVLEKGRIVGAIILGDRKGVTSIKKLMDQQVDITTNKNSILEDNFDFKVFS